MPRRPKPTESRYANIDRVQANAEHTKSMQDSEREDGEIGRVQNSECAQYATVDYDAADITSAQFMQSEGRQQRVENERAVGNRHTSD
jgi:hypothetical protein